MAISVPIPKEITEYEEKIIFGLSIRKLISTIILLILVVPTGYLCTKYLHYSMDTTSYIIIVEAMPIMAVGFIKKNGMPFEKYIVLFARHRIGKNRLSYGTHLVINDIEFQLPTENEGESKYAWIFSTKKETEKKGDCTSRRKRCECQEFKITKKGRKKKCKATCRTSKAARQEYRAAKHSQKKGVKESCGATDDGAADRL